jgi:hypothetical protein
MNNELVKLNLDRIVNLKKSLEFNESIKRNSELFLLSCRNKKIVDYEEFRLANDMFLTAKSSIDYINNEIKLCKKEIFDYDK